jgi:hypothetical protein
LAHQIGKYLGETIAILVTAAFVEFNESLFAKGIVRALKHVELRFQHVVTTETLCKLMEKWLLTHLLFVTPQWLKIMDKFHVLDLFCLPRSQNASQKLQNR